MCKWYFDVVAEDGTAFIGYAARLQWGALQVRYCATLLAPPYQPTSETFTLRASPDPVLDPEGKVHWSCAPLRLDGVWTPRCAPVRRRLFASDAGEVDWECIAPAADVHLRLRDREMRGAGYAERLTLTAPPWTLGLDELLWGRFIADDEVVVWVDWRGPEPRRLVVRNGIDASDAIVSAESITMPSADARIELGAGRPLREGPLVDVLAAVPRLADVLPRWLGQGHESKRLSDAMMVAGDGYHRKGWAIHEVVAWRERVPA